MPGRATAILAVLTLCACAVSDPESALDDSRPALEDGTVEALGILGLLNDPTTTFELLDDAVGLDRRAAANLIAYRNGSDGSVGTADDRAFGSVAEIDAVRWVGSSAIAKLVDYATANGWVPGDDDPFGSFDGVPFTVGEALAALDLVNSATESALGDGVDLDRRAVSSILAARPIESMSELASLYYVGSAMLQRIKAFVSAREIGVVSDLDKTVIPPHDDVLPDAPYPDAPYPGVASLYTALEGRHAGDVYYVTARPDSMIDGIAEWLAAQAVPTGPIATGVSPIPYLARAEKVADISAIFDANPGQQFVLLGDTNHVDADAFRDIIEIYEDRVIVAFVHDVKPIDPERIAGLVLFEDYADVARTLEELGLLDVATAAAIIEETTN
jgi:hypothetical protein